MKLLPPVRCWLLLAPLVWPASPALAHAGFPDTTSIAVRREHPEDMLLGATFGAVVTRDSGKTWRWLCPEGIGYGGWNPESYLWQPDGTLLAATGSQLIRSNDGGCTWKAHEYFTSRNLWPMGLASPPSQPSRLWVTTARSTTPNGLFRSDDGGESFTATSLQRTDAVFTAVKVAPSDARRLYVSGNTPDGLRLFRSDDEGATWEEIPQPFPEYSATSRPYDLFVLRVADTDPNRLWARVTSQGWTYVLESQDGGHTFTSVIHPANQPTRDGLDEYLIGLEVSADGNTLWAATPTRLFRSRNREPAALLSLPEGNACVQRQGETLLVCGASRVHDWALARTTTEGDSYEPLFDLPQLLPPACPSGTPVQNLCRTRWPQFAETVGANPTLPPDESGSTDAGTLEPDAGTVDPGTPDAGSPDDTKPPSKSDGCSTTGGLVPAACFLALTLLRRSQRRNPET
jgi:photosystem II stability/assembly factor-like uncharacterized protein